MIQGSAADLIKLAMIAISRRLESEDLPARMLLQIHDELIFETPARTFPAWPHWFPRKWPACGRLKVPLKVDLESGPNWAEAKKYG